MRRRLILGTTGRKKAKPPALLIAVDTLFMYKQDTSWTGARDAVSATWWVSDPSSSVGAFIDGSSYKVYRSFAQFDFSAIEGVIATATLNIKCRSNTSATNLTEVAIQLCSSNGILATSDFDSLGAFLGSSVNYSIEGNDWIFHIPLNALGITEINKKGIVRFVVRDYTHDYMNIEVTDNSQAYGNGNTSAIIDLTY